MLVSTRAKIHYFKKIIFFVIAFSTTTSSPIQVPLKAKQYAVFTKVFINALWNFITNKKPHTAIEQKLAQLYQQQITTLENPNTAAYELKKAIKNNPQITIKPDNFLIGASSSAYQVEGGLDETSASARFYESRNLPPAGDAIDFYNRYKTDIKDMKEQLGINAHRISIAWNRIQPTKDTFDENGIAFYRNLINEYTQHGIKPIVVFHHYDVPTWFEDLGGFEKQENGKFFRNFALKLYEELPQELGNSIISMCNAPEGPAFKGHWTGDSTPGKKDDLQMTHTIIANMYHELVETALQIKERYKQLSKTKTNIKEPYIGTQVNIVPIDPLEKQNGTWKDRLKSLLGCSMGEYVQIGGTYNFLLNGEYCMFTPNANFLKKIKNVNVYRSHPEAHKAFDWIGVNIYSNRFVDGFTPVNNKDLNDPEERQTENPNYRNYPEGIYRAIQLVSQQLAEPLGKRKNKDHNSLPIIVTENGIATQDEEKRKHFFQRALCTITQAIKDGYRVEGYTPWASHDNYEWPTQESPQPFGTKRYGFFHVNFDKNSPDYLKRTLKESSQYYADFAKEFFKSK